MQLIAPPTWSCPCAVIAKVVVSPATYVTGVATEVTTIVVSAWIGKYSVEVPSPKSAVQLSVSAPAAVL